MSEIRQIIKRDGRTVDFDISKISDAIYKAAEVLGGQDRDTSNYLARQVELYLLEVRHNEIPTVEQIQDAVEKVLIENGHARTAKEFILYRAERTRVRDMNTRLMKTYEDLTFKNAKDNDRKRENANIDGDTAMGTMLKYGSEGAKQFYEMFVLKPEHAKAHREGDIHDSDDDLLPDRYRKTLQGRFFDRSRPSQRAERYSELFSTGLHSDPVQPERSARRTEHS